jgi:hypothetical protein
MAGYHVALAQVKRTTTEGETVNIKTQDLIGLALDWAVAKCEGMEPFSDGISWIVDTGDVYEQLPDYSTDWSQGGPIIEREIIGLDYDGAIGWEARDFDSQQILAIGPTPLIAAMRCYVASKLGDEVEVPEELKP